jgi:hypothetical protein
MIGIHFERDILFLSKNLLLDAIEMTTEILIIKNGMHPMDMTGR